MLSKVFDYDVKNSISLTLPREGSSNGVRATAPALPTRYLDACSVPALPCMNKVTCYDKNNKIKQGVRQNTARNYNLLFN